MTVVQYGERAFSQIRRFVIVDVRHGFVYAWYVGPFNPFSTSVPTPSCSPISTYSHRGTTKSGCISSEHSAVYFENTAPVTYPGEIGMRNPICIRPADASLRMHDASRLHYAKVWPIEMNVKVKDIGEVHPEHLSDLVRNYKEANGLSPPQPQSFPPYPSYGANYGTYHSTYGA